MNEKMSTYSVFSNERTLKLFGTNMIEFSLCVTKSLYTSGIFEKISERLVNLHIEHKTHCKWTWVNPNGDFFNINYVMDVIHTDAMKGVLAENMFVNE